MALDGFSNRSQQILRKDSLADLLIDFLVLVDCQNDSVTALSQLGVDRLEEAFKIRKISGIGSWKSYSLFQGLFDQRDPRSQALKRQ